MNNSEFNLQNVKCAGCVGKIQSALNKVTGIKTAQVNLLDKTLYIEYLDVKLDKLVIAEVEKLGFGASLDVVDEQKINLSTNIALPLIAGMLLMTIGMLPQFMINPTTPSGFFLGIIYGLTSLTIILGVGSKIIKSGYIGFKTLNFNMHSLILLGVGSAWLYSLSVVLIVHYSKISLPHHLYFDSALMILGLINLGAYFEESAKNNTTAAIKSLTSLVPQTTTIIVDGAEQQIATNLLRTDNLIKIRPGEQLPADGEVVDGDGYIDEAMLSGEPLPVYKTISDKVSSGTINTSGAFTYRVSAVGGNTLLGEIIKLVKSAQLTKPPLAKIADKVARIFVPTIIIIAAVSGLIWYFLAASDNFATGLAVFMTVLIIACPCSVGLAIPVALMVGIGRGAAQGILIRDASCLGQIDKLQVVLFDKTGTLTVGKPQVVNFEHSQEISATKALQILKNLELNSEHPLAHALLRYQPEIIANNHSEEFKSIAGKGVSAIIDDITYYAGSAAWMKEMGLIDSKLIIDNHYSQIYLATQDKILARVDISDILKPDTTQTVAKLKAQGLSVAMVTGDNRSSAKHIAQQAGIGEIFAECKPQDKIAIVKQYQAQGKIVAFVGDGINDAPSLAQAEIGIAIGGGTDIALQTASISLLRGQLSAVDDALKLARKINLNMRQNLFGSFIYNSLAVAIAAGALYPLWGILLNPVIASVVMSLSSITVIANALRLRFA
ncbi:MAG TPA: heavy metal translocating P-type ATPase [Burkholderiales bacterium]|nr:heavy metal translocating P-type ATPase [Burkholderiales bacterium]